jgi:lipopolysaccharide export system protein LptC
MNRAVTANRFRLAILVTLSLVLVLGSYWVLEVLRKSGDGGAAQPVRTAPDYYVQKFTFVKMAKASNARYNISGDLLVHNPKDDSFEVTRPIVNNLVSGRPATVMHSDRALVNSDSSEIQMIGNVDVNRPASGASERFHMISTYLMLLPDDDIMKTDKPVELTLGTTVLHGTGMVANNSTRQLNLASRVHGVYVPAVAK